MERFFSKKRRGQPSCDSATPAIEVNVEVEANVEDETNFDEYVRDPGLRKPIEEFPITIRDQARREYLSMGPCQVVGHTYPKTQFGNQLRSFQDVWYQKFVWLEYSVAKDACFCFWCYIFKHPDKTGRYGADAFTKTGFTNWKKALIKFVEHVGDADSCHNNARVQIEAFKNQRGSMVNMFRSNACEVNIAYRARLTASLDVTRFLLKQGLSFRGHDESNSSSNRGDCLCLPQQLRNFIAFVRNDSRFSTITNLGSLAQEMVKSGNHLVFRMIELTLVLPVATASVERAFSAMKIVKTDLRNRMKDEWMNDSLVVYIEKEIFSTIDNEKILQRFQSMSTRRNQLSFLSQTETTSSGSPSVYS
ncbi:uncharacterized protein LOC130984957 isoform X1 [Salvia miltiorrhiza]|uniref:uncharacterized protein LOC130984957 isoform X1 n=1 Tax=Salvia miltiorrhiza TaxID=226208 RepID=UPI0025AB5ED0|nr:uncharacterized protein LOC130984957 isoform X1 [Salvia miltiorrhiza]